VSFPALCNFYPTFTKYCFKVVQMYPGIAEWNQCVNTARPESHFFANPSEAGSIRTKGASVERRGRLGRDEIRAKGSCGIASQRKICSWFVELWKAWYFSYFFCRKAELLTRQMQLQLNARQLLSFVRSNANKIERVLTPLWIKIAEIQCATADSLLLCSVLFFIALSIYG